MSYSICKNLNDRKMLINLKTIVYAEQNEDEKNTFINFGFDDITFTVIESIQEIIDNSFEIESED